MKKESILLLGFIFVCLFMIACGNSNSSKDEKTSEFEPEKIKLGDVISNDFVEMQFSYYDITDDVHHVYEGEEPYVSLHYEANAGEKYFVIEGTLTNTSGKAYNLTGLDGKIIFDDKYEYDIMSCIDNEDGVNAYAEAIPLKKQHVFLLCSIPDELIGNYASYKVEIYFDDKFEKGGLVIEPEKRKYWYSMQ